MDLRAAGRDTQRFVSIRIKEEVYRRSLLGSAIYIAEFPKSGGTWVQNLTRDLQIAASPPRVRRLVHNHWSYRQSYRPAIYVLRDGRDVALSLYFHHTRELARRSILASRIDRYFTHVLGKDYSVDNVSGNLPAFVASLAEYPHGGMLRPRRAAHRLSWPLHIGNWAERPGTLTVRYEDTLADTFAVCTQIASHCNFDVNDNTIRGIVETNSFQVVAGRSPGTEDRSSFLRKGIAGDWKHYFTPEAARAFDDFAGETLRRLGYEIDESWVSRCAPLELHAS